MSKENPNRPRTYLGPLALKLMREHGDGTITLGSLEQTLSTLLKDQKLPLNNDPSKDYGTECKLPDSLEEIRKDIAELRRVQWMNLRVVSRELALTRQLMLATISEHAGEEMREVIEIVEDTISKFHNDLDTPVLQKADKASVQWMEEIRRQQEIDRGQESDVHIEPEAKDKEPEREI